MSGTLEGGKLAASTNKAKYGADFYKRIGAKGGKKGVTGGFYADRDLAKQAGILGGQISKRGHKLIGYDPAGQPVYEKVTKK